MVFPKRTATWWYCRNLSDGSLLLAIADKNVSYLLQLISCFSWKTYRRSINEELVFLEEFIFLAVDSQWKWCVNDFFHSLCKFIFYVWCMIPCVCVCVCVFCLFCVLFHLFKSLLLACATHTNPPGSGHSTRGTFIKEHSYIFFVMRMTVRHRIIFFMKLAATHRISSSPWSWQ